jgi:LPXTG-site transpeptidase (sortase) family protein
MKLIMKRFKLSIVIGAAFILIGVGSLLLYRNGQGSIVTPAPKQAQISAQRAPTVSQSTSKPVVSGNPSRISIPSLGIDLAITPGVYNARTGQWTLTNDKVQYAVMTPQPNNQGGNTFLYGHYRKSVFASLHLIQPDSTAIITTDSGKKFTYVLTTVKVVSPEDSASIFDYQGPPILTVQTCTGAFFQNRQLFTFSLESVS